MVLERGKNECHNRIDHSRRPLRLTWTRINRIRHPCFPILLANTLVFSVRLTFAQLLRQIGRPRFGECRRHTPNCIRPTAHILFDGFRYHFQQYTAAVQMPNGFDRGHIAGQYIFSVYAGMQ